LKSPAYPWRRAYAASSRKIPRYRERLLFTGDHVPEGVSAEINCGLMTSSASLLRTLEAHLIKLAREGRAGGNGGLWHLGDP